MLAGPFIAGVISYLVMLIAMRLHRIRALHISLMTAIVLFDLSMPFYLYATRDWKTRLIDDGDILSFGVWTHFGLIVALFVLYAIQIMAGRKLMRGDDAARSEHKSSAIGILLVRALVIVSGGMLAQEPIR